MAEKRTATGQMATGRTIGIDIGDLWSQICVVNAAGSVVEEARVRTTARAVQRRFAPAAPSRVVLEVGTHSPWHLGVLTGEALS